MQRLVTGSCFALLLLFQAATNTADASIVRFAGTWTNYTPFAGAADPLAILGQTFGITADVDGAGNVTSGYIRITSGPGSQYNVAFTGNAGAVSNSPFALNNIPTASGGLLSISIPMNIPNFSPASLDLLNGQGGAATLGGNFGAGIGFYSAGISAVPEPGSAGVLLGLVAGCVGFYRRRKSV